MMILTAGILLACFLVQTNAEIPPDFLGPRIVGGLRVTNRSDFAYQASIRYRGSHMCGGTIVDSRHVITAAHCCFDDKDKILNPKDLTVVVGDLNIYWTSPTTVNKAVTAIFTHSKYDSKTVANDIAVLRVAGNFTWNSSAVQSISWASKLPTPSTQCVVSGWGAQISGGRVSADLYYVKINTIDMSTCKSAYGSKTIKSGMFCAGNYPAGNKDACQGDSGGPLICNNLLTGVVSWGDGCGGAYKPGVYTDVSEYTKWIKKQFERSAADISSTQPVFIIVAIMLHHFIFY